MNIQVDSREKAKAIKNILTEFSHQGVDYYVSKLYVGDYMNLDNPRLIIDRKQNLTELCSNACQGHERFRKELLRANEAGINMIVLCEHGKGVERLEDVIWWDNPRRHKRIRDPDTGKWTEVETNAITGEKLYKILKTIERKYKCSFQFCSPEETGKKILEILGGIPDDSGRD